MTMKGRLATLTGVDHPHLWQWHLIDEPGQRLPILCPILRGNGEIEWRWNPGGG
jgi:hypothetical protein